MATHETAPTRLIAISTTTTIAYRLFGTPTGTPLLFLQHYRGTMDHWDPLLLDTLSLTRPILIFDYAGTGFSSGSMPTTFSDIASDTASLLHALQIPLVDLLGFSIGGFAAQMLALDHPELISHLILAGTGPSAAQGLQPTGEGIFEAFTTATTVGENRAIYLKGFYAPSEVSQTLGEAVWDRILTARKGERSGYVGAEGTANQVAAVQGWLTGEGNVSYPRLGELKMKTLVVAGTQDDVVRVENSLVLWKVIEGAEVHIYPGAAHGFMSQYVGFFVRHLELFLAN